MNQFSKTARPSVIENANKPYVDTLDTAINDRVDDTNGRVLLLEKGDFANIHVSDGSTPQTILKGVDYTMVTGFTVDGWNSVSVPDHDNDKITINDTGYYFVSGSCSFKINTNNVVVFCALFVDNVEQDDVHWSRKISTGADMGNANFSGIIKIEESDAKVQVGLRHDYAPTDITFTPLYMSLTIIKIGDL
jgi:hypothetical protein